MSLSAAIKEAYATCAPDVVVLDTLEIYHPDWAAPIRIVRDRVDFEGTLESTAPNNPSTEVTFTAYPFDLTLPRTGDGPQDMTLTISNVTRLLMDILEAADMSDPVPVRVIYRPFLSTDTTAPAWNPPLKLQVKAISATPVSVSLTCGYLDFANRRFPRKVYNTTEFPGIAPRV